MNYVCTEHIGRNASFWNQRQVSHCPRRATWITSQSLVEEFCGHKLLISTQFTVFQKPFSHLFIKWLASFYFFILWLSVCPPACVYAHVLSLHKLLLFRPIRRKERMSLIFWYLSDCSTYSLKWPFNGVPPES